MKTILQYLQNIFKSTVIHLSLAIYFSVCPSSAQISSFEVEFDYQCAPTIVTLTNNSSTGTGIEYLWDFGKGAIIPSEEKILYEAFTEPGAYTITLAVVDGSDTVRSSQEIYIAEGPVASFVADPTEGCVPHTVAFTENSEEGDAPISEVFWDFRDGQTAIGQTIDHTFTLAGKNNVFMQVTDENGCTSYTEIPDLITIHSLPIVDFSASDSFACNAPLSVSFLNLSEGSGELESLWDFGNDSTSSDFGGSILYTEPGSYNVSLQITDENNCSNLLVKESFINIGSQSADLYVLINGEPVFDQGIPLCQGNLTFGTTLPVHTDNKWIVDYNGNIQTFLNLDEITVNAPDSGTIDVSLHYGQNTVCPDSLKKSYHIDYVRANFEMDQEYTCSLPIDLLLTNTSENQTDITWYLPDGSTGNNDTLTTSINRELNYEDIYTHEVINKFIPIMLVAGNESGCRDTLTKDFRVNLPVARFMPDVSSGCVPFDVIFSDSSKSVETIIEWEYFIDDKTFGQSDNTPLTYRFENPGIYEVTLAITNNAGCTDTSYTVEIRAGEKLFPEFTVDPATICYGNTINLDSDTPPAGMVDTWQYSSNGIFNTGTIATPNTSVVVFPSSQGSKDVHLVIESNYCVSDTTLENAFTVENPTGYFDYTFSCDSPLVYTFISHMVNADELLWTIGTDEFTDIDTLRYVFSSTGDFTVTLNATNSTTGCTVNKSRTVKVRNVKAAFSVKQVLCVGEETAFNASSSVDYTDECFIEGFLWNFDDDRPPRRNYNSQHYYTYFEEGEYHPWLVVTADNGCTDTVETFISVVLPPAEFSVSPDSGCGPVMEVDFSYDNLNETIVSWQWLFGDMTSDATNNPNPVHHYASLYDEDYIATLFVLDEYGCQNYFQKPIHISVPNAYFQAVDPGLCLGEQAVFVPSDPGLDSYLWDYGDESPPGIQNTHVYSETGSFTVSLSVEKDGCLSSNTRSNYISVEQADASYIVSDSTPDCYPASIIFTHTGTSGTVASGNWTYQPGIQSPRYDPVTEYTYSDPGTYVTSLTIQTVNNCVASASKIIEVNGPQVDFLFSPVSICSGDTVSFNILQSDELDEFEWIFGDGNVSNEIAPQHIYFGNGTLFPALRVVKDDCEVTLSNQSLRIFEPDARFVIQGENGTLCIGAPLNTTNESSQFSLSIWSIDGTEVATSNHLTDYYLNQPGEHLITLEIVNSIGCTDTTSQSIEVIPLPAFEISGDTLICPGAEAQLHVDAQPGWNISWQPVLYVNNSNSFSPLAHPPVNSEFVATVTDENSCANTDNIWVHIEEEPNIERIPVSDTSIMIGESIQLFIQSDKENTNYSWSPSYSISCNSCQDPVVRPDKDITYTAVVQDNCYEFSFDFNIEVIINFYLELPKAFTPNGDGENDIFLIEADHVSEVDFKIFNRWGNLVYTSQDLSQGWNGRYNGKLQNPDTYTYYIRAVTDHGYEFERKGTFLLLR